VSPNYRGGKLKKNTQNPNYFWGCCGGKNNLVRQEDGSGDRWDIQKKNREQNITWECGDMYWGGVFLCLVFVLWGWLGGWGGGGWGWVGWGCLGGVGGFWGGGVVGYLLEAREMKKPARSWLECRETLSGGKWCRSGRGSVK